MRHSFQLRFEVFLRFLNQKTKNWRLKGPVKVGVFVLKMSRRNKNTSENSFCKMLVETFWRSSVELKLQPLDLLSAGIPSILVSSKIKQKTD